MQSGMDGILNIDKPLGKTSFGVVAFIRRLTGERRVGHAGTLDPQATGVLLVCLGRATRVVEFLMDSAKTYRAEIELGVTTDSYDAEGAVVRCGDASGVTREHVEAALAAFLGPIEQTPPMYSALKRGGRPLYELARAGITVERRRRRVEVHRMDLVAWRPPLVTVEVECSKGTYIRSLAHDLGQALGCGASLRSLARLACGPFNVAGALSLVEFEDAVRRGCWRQLLQPIDSALSHLRAFVVDEGTARAIRNGSNVALGGEKAEASAGERCRAYSQDGQLLGVLRFDAEAELWHPDKVFA